MVFMVAAAAAAFLAALALAAWVQGVMLRCP